MTQPLPWSYDDGGRAAAGYRGSAGDCVTRAIAIATQRPYVDVYEDLFARMRADRYIARVGGRTSPRSGVPTNVFRDAIRDFGWKWTPLVVIGSRHRAHLVVGELPPVDRLIARVSKHLCAVVDGTVRDTHDPSRDGTRMVYGVWTPS